MIDLVMIKADRVIEDKDEFLRLLNNSEEELYGKNKEEVVQYILPLLDFYLRNFLTVQMSNGRIDHVTIKDADTQLGSLCFALESLKNNQLINK